MRIVVKDNYEEMAASCAEFICAYIDANPGRLLCFAAGDTPLGILGKLIETQKSGKVNLSTMYYAGLDEWVGLGYEDKGSCRQIMADSFYNPAKIPGERLRVFDGKADADFENAAVLDFINAKGGIGLAMLGIGMNGHIGFNEPGAKDNFEGGKVLLSENSRMVGQKYFDKTQNLEYGVTLGIKTLAASETVILIASGETKADIIAHALKTNNDPNLPASYLTNHPNYHVFLDKAAYTKY